MNHFTTCISIENGNATDKDLLRRYFYADPKIGVAEFRSSNSKNRLEIELRSAVKIGLEDFSRAVSHAVTQTSAATRFFIIREKRNVS